MRVLLDNPHLARVLRLAREVGDAGLGAEALRRPPVLSEALSAYVDGFAYRREQEAAQRG